MLKSLIRNFCWPTLFTIFGVGLLLSLGTWQLQRLSWKESVLENIAQKFSCPIQEIELLLQQPMRTIQQAEYQRVQMTGTFLHDQELKLMAKSFNGKWGFHVITPMVLTSGSTILVDRGWVPDHGAVEIKRPEGLQTLVGFVRTQSPKTRFTPPNNLAKSEIFSIEPAEIARFKHLTTLLPFFVVEESHPQKTGFPYSRGLDLNLQNHHLQYAITWYTLAAILILFYILYIRKRTLH
jgi:surfeit locus 1 family protein